MTYEEFERRYDYDPNTARIGGGSFGQVYKAKDTVRKRSVAIKECKVEPNKFTLEREVRLIAELGPHDNIARYENNYRFKLGRVEMDYAVMHYYEEGSLATVLAEYTLTHAERIDIVRGMLKGLKFIHEEGFIHRDIKPDNVLMLKQDGQWIPKIADFGMSKLKNQNKSEKDSDDLTHNSAIAKTLAYSAPEQIQNRSIKDNTDLWALGVAVYRMCTGRLPYDSDATTSRETYNLAVSKQIVSGQLPDLKGIKEPFCSLIERCLVFDMDKRVQTASKLIELLDSRKVEEPEMDKKVEEAGTDERSPIAEEKAEDKPLEKSPPPPLVDTDWKKNILGIIAILIGIAVVATTVPNFFSGSKPEEVYTADTAAVDTSAIDITTAVIENLIPMVYVEGGTFEMGSNEGQADEKPVHSVTVGSFYMGKYEVTQAQWRAVMGNNPSYFKDCDDCPVEKVSWKDAQAFIKKLNAQTGKTYCLPTEAEWEYAAGGGSTNRTRFGNGKNILAPSEANFDGSAAYKIDYSVAGTYRVKTVPVGSFAPNRLGLYDMSGNVWEWCADRYKGYPSSTDVSDDTNTNQVLRGGSWLGAPNLGRVANRFSDTPARRYYNCGFRLVSHSQ